MQRPVGTAILSLVNHQHCAWQVRNNQNSKSRLPIKNKLKNQKIVQEKVKKSLARFLQKVLEIYDVLELLGTKNLARMPRIFLTFLFVGLGIGLNYT